MNSSGKVIACTALLTAVMAVPVAVRGAARSTPPDVVSAEELVVHFTFRQTLVNFFTLADQRIAAYVEARSAAGLDVAESTAILLTARDRSQEGQRASGLWCDVDSCRPVCIGR